jgi:hypothetical protein
MEILIIIGLAFNTAISYFIAQNARSREIGMMNSFIYCFLFGFFVGSLITMTSRQLERDEKNGQDYSERISRFVWISILVFSIFYIGIRASNKNNIGYYNYNQQKVSLKYDDFQPNKEMLEIVDYPKISNYKPIPKK